MNSIYGFIDSRNRVSQFGNDLLDVMREKLGHASPEVLHTDVAPPGCALGCHRKSGALFSNKNLQVAVTGRPWWSERTLQSLALEHGHAHAAAEAYRGYGVGLLEHLHGPFALAIVEPDKGHALLAVDRMGICPLSFSAVDGTLVISSRTDGIVGYPGASRELDPQGLYNYLYFHMVPSPGCIYRGMEKLLPGEYLTYANGAVSRAAYWWPEYQESGAREGQLADELLLLLERSVLGCVTDEATGAFLSGGLDSSTVTGMLAKLRDTKVDAYGIGFAAEGYDEMEFARATARHFNVKLHEYYVTPQDVIDAIPTIAAAYDEPFGNASAIPAYYCANLARQDGMSCLLAGDGGDEIFAGNERYAKQLLLGAYLNLPELLRKRLIEPVFLSSSLLKQLPLARKICSYIEQARQPMPDRMQAYNFLHRTRPEDIFEVDFLAGIDTDAPMNNLREAYESAGTASMLKRMLHMDLKITLADNDLRKVSRMCELAGIEVRYPMLDEELMAFSARVPTRMLIHRMELRSFYRRALRGFLAPETLDKSKHGFGLPFGIWLTSHAGLRELAYDSLTDFKRRQYVRDDYIDRIVREHQGSHAGYYGVMIWIMMMLEQWLKAHEQ